MSQRDQKLHQANCMGKHIQKNLVTFTVLSYECMCSLYIMSRSVVRTLDVVLSQETQTEVRHCVNHLLWQSAKYIYQCCTWGGGICRPLAKSPLPENFVNINHPPKILNIQVLPPPGQFLNATLYMRESQVENTRSLIVIVVGMGLKLATYCICTKS